MELETNYTYIRLSNFNRVSGTPTNFNIDLSNDTRLHQCTDAWVDKVTVPNMFYNIDTHNNILNFTATNAGGAPSIVDSVVVPVGFYTITQLMDVLKTLLDVALTPIAGTVTFTQDPINNLVSFTTTGMDGISFLIASAGTTVSTISPALGNTVLYPEAPTGTFADMPALSGEKMIYLHSKDINLGNTSLSTLNNQVLQPNTNRSVSAFCSIPVDVPFKANINYRSNGDDVDKLRLEGIQDLGKVNIKLRSRDGRLLKLGDNQELTIVLKVFY